MFEQVHRFYFRNDFVGRVAALFQLRSYRDRRSFERELHSICKIADDLYYDQGACEEAATLFQLIAGIAPRFEEALHGAVLVLGQCIFRFEEALPYAVVLDSINPKRNAEAYILGKLKNEASYND